MTSLPLLFNHWPTWRNRVWSRTARIVSRLVSGIIFVIIARVKPLPANHHVQTAVLTSEGIGHEVSLLTCNCIRLPPSFKRQISLPVANRRWPWRRCRMIPLVLSEHRFKRRFLSSRKRSNIILRSDVHHILSCSDGALSADALKDFSRSEARRRQNAVSMSLGTAFCDYRNYGACVDSNAHDEGICIVNADWKHK
jgi:hypothetical protein